MAESMQGLKRTHRCGELSAANVGETATIMGWVQKNRNKGGLVFVDVRDRSGIIQVVFDEGSVDAALIEKAAKLRSEYVVAVVGKVAKRSGAVNENIATGEIEIIPEELRVLSESQTPPFPIEENSKTKEDIRLKYRYLDLRNAKVKDNIIFRSQVISFLRQKMTEMGFLEIHTPILCASSPEGARDYIVPSRKYKGKFYALPQAPQQYKQLLMVSGFDKYFQVAPCFRDEDARADRSPGEFYQLDFEMSFATQEDVFRVGEEVLSAAFEKFAPEGYAVTQAPYPIISYKQAMLEFGCDKPDLRNPLRIIDVTDFFQKCTFKPFVGRTVRAIKVHAEMSKGFHEKLLKFATDMGMGGLGYPEVAEDMTYKGPIDKFIPDELKGQLARIASLAAGDTIFFIADKEERANYYAGQLRNELGDKLDLCEKNAYRFCYVNDFPMYEIDPETKQLGFTHNPFSMPQGGLEALETKNPLDVLAYQYDIVCNGVDRKGSVGSTLFHPRRSR